MSDAVAGGLRVAVVGAGPAGFYATGHLLASGQVSVDLFDRLPTPFGLVRAGVAPDHPKIKSVVRVFDRIAANPRLRFFGSVALGRDLSRDELRDRYDAVVYAMGAATDRRLGIPGEDLPGSMPATAFVGWYNGHPDHAGHPVALDCERAVVVGNGNVAIDCARMLVLGDDALRATDAADHAIEALTASSVREVVVLGRRGPSQAAFTTPELLELGVLDGARVVVDPGELERDVALAPAAAAAGVPLRETNLDVLRGYAGREGVGGRAIVLRFCAMPVEIRGEGRVEEIVVERTALSADADGRIRAVATGERQTLSCGLVLRSIGYRGVPVAGVPFDAERGVIPNEDGRVVDGEHHRTGEYVCGWLRRGPSGVIGTNKKCGQGAAQNVLDDAAAGRLSPAVEAEDVAVLLAGRDAAHVDWDGWRRIDHHEVSSGAGVQRPRIKLTTYAELDRVARAG